MNRPPTTPLSHRLRAMTDSFLPLLFAALVVVSGLVPAASAQAPPLPPLVASAAFASPLLAGSGTLFSDNFDDNVLDVTKWTIANPGYSTGETNQRLEMSVREQVETAATVRSSTISRSFTSSGGVDANVNQMRHVSGSGVVERIRFRLERSDDATKWVEIIYDAPANKINLQDSNANVYALATSIFSGYHALRLVATGSTYTGYYDGTSHQVSSTLFSGASGVKIAFVDATGGSTTGATETAARDDAIVYTYSPGAPSAPQNLQAYAGPGRGNIRLTWQAPSIGASTVTNYNIYRGDTSTSESFLTTVGNVLTWTDSGLPDGTPFYYYVAAINSAGSSPATNEATATTYQSPSAPTLQASSGSPDANGVPVALSWSTPSSTGGSAITGYALERGPASGGETSYQTLGNVHSYNDHCPAATNCYYVVRAVNIVGPGAASNEVSYKATPTDTCPPPTTSPTTTVCGIGVCGPTGTTQEGTTVCGITLGDDNPPEFVDVPHEPIALTPTPPGPLATEVNLAFVFAQRGYAPQVGTTASAGGPFELDLLFSGLDYSRPMSLTIRSASGLQSGYYQFSVDADDVDGIHATVILREIPAVVGGRYELDTSDYHAAFYPLQQGSEYIPDYCHGAALNAVCIESGICTDSADEGVSCNPSECMVAGQSPCALPNQLIEELGDDVDGLLAECREVTAASQSTTPPVPCQAILELVGSIPPILEGLIHDALAGCGLDIGPAQQSETDLQACQQVLDAARSAPALVLNTTRAVLESCGLDAPLSSSAAVQCADILAEILAIPGTVLDAVKDLADECGSQSSSASTGSSQVDCQDILQTISELPQTINGLVQQYLGECLNTSGTSNSEVNCQSLLQTILEVPTMVLQTVKGVLADCSTNFQASTMSTCSTVTALVNAVKTLAQGLVPECTQTNAKVPSPCGGLDCGDCLKLQIGGRMSQSSSSSNCENTYRFTTERSDLSQNKIHPYDPNEDRNVDFEMATIFMEMTYGSCNNPESVYTANYGMGFGWRGPTQITEGTGYDLDWVVTAVGSETPTFNYNYDPVHYLDVKPYVFLYPGNGDGQVSVRDSEVVGMAADSSDCSSQWRNRGDWASLMADMWYNLPKRAGHAIALVSTLWDTYCETPVSKTWLRLGCPDDSGDGWSHCHGVGIHKHNVGIEPAYNGGVENDGNTYGGDMRLKADKTGNYNLNFWNSAFVYGSAQAPNSGGEVAISGWIGHGDVAQAFVRPPH